MKKTLQAWVLASALSVATPWQSASVDTSNIIDDTKAWVSSTLSFGQNFDNSVYSNILNTAINNKNSLDTAINSQNLFPSQVRTIGLDRMSSAMLGNIKKWWLDVIHPPFVDYWWFEEVYCAGTMKWFLWALKNPSDRTSLENSYINREWVDAWMLPDQLKKAGLYYQFYDHMDHFDFDKVGQNNIIKDKEKYYQSLLQTGNHLKNHWVEWSMLFIYFNLSSYKWRVKEYNQEKLLTNPNAQLSINTHQAMFLGNSDMQFEADDIKNIQDWNMLQMTQDIDVINYIANFVQNRGWYISALNNNTKNTIIDNMNYFHSMIDFYINWEKVDLYDELQKPEWQRVQVSPDDDIKISGPILMDGFHDANSNNEYISQNNHVRTLFYFEFVTIGTYSPSELMIPNDNLKNSHWVDSKYNEIINQLDITNLYYLRKDEHLSLKLKEAILRYHFEMFDELSLDENELDLIQKIQSLPKNSRERTSLNFDAISYRSEKIQSLIDDLDASQRNIFYNEYQNQIKWLQLMWYMQDEWELNPWAVNINAPIPYFDTSNIPWLHFEYVEQKKQDIISSYIENANLWSDSVDLFFFPWDNFATIYSQLQSKLSLYSDRYQNFDKLDWLDLLKRHKLLDIIIDKYYNEKDIDITRWQIPSMSNVTLPLDFVNNVLDEMLDESYVESVELSDLDSMVIETISKNREDFDILAHILVQESYENWIPLRKLMKEVWRMLWKISSYWDFQLRLNNLKNINNSLIRLPNVEQLQRAIWYINDPDIQKIIERRKLRYEEDIDSDLQIVEQIEKKIKYVSFLTNEQRLEIWEEVYELLKELFRFNDSRQINIVWKVVQSSLILDKMHGHYYNLNWWLLASWVHTDEILYNSDLQSRYKKLLLVINNRSEKTTLIWTWENYLLRVLEALGEDIAWENYPKLERNMKWNIWYWTSVLSDRLSFYSSRLKSISNENNSHIVDELLSNIQNIKQSNYSALKYYELFENKTIKSFLAQNWYDTYLLPTLSEFENTSFRELFYDYADTPEWMEPPKNWWDVEEVVKLWSVAWVISLWLWYLWYLRRKLKKHNKLKITRNNHNKKNIS